MVARICAIFMASLSVILIDRKLFIPNQPHDAKLILRILKALRHLKDAKAFMLMIQSVLKTKWRNRVFGHDWHIGIKVFLMFTSTLHVFIFKSLKFYFGNVVDFKVVFTFSICDDSQW